MPLVSILYMLCNALTDPASGFLKAISSLTEIQNTAMSGAHRTGGNTYQRARGQVQNTKKTEKSQKKSKNTKNTKKHKNHKQKKTDVPPDPCPADMHFHLSEGDEKGVQSVSSAQDKVEHDLVDHQVICGVSSAHQRQCWV